MKQPHLELLFPTPIILLDVERHLEYKEKFVPLLMEKMKDNPGNSLQWNSIDNCWSATHDLVGDDLTPIDEQIENAVRGFIGYCKGFPYAYEGNLEYQGWWNVYNQHAYMEIHDHAECAISGIYYLQLDLNKDYPAGFMNPCSQLIERWSSNNNMGDKNSVFMSHTHPNFLDIKEGMLLLFPPHLQHFVRSSKTLDDHYRISYAFNVTI